jgi:hypothetical protein
MVQRQVLEEEYEDALRTGTLGDAREGDELEERLQ